SLFFSGWVCYAEKTYGEGFSLVPYLSRTRSPQQTIGRLVKLNNPKSVFHITIMPCFDKKLEASRSEFTEDGQIPDVDLVLATNELVQLIGDCSTAHDWTAAPPVLSSLRQENFGSGGYSTYVFIYAAQKLFNITLSDPFEDPRVLIRQLHNRDLQVRNSFQVVYTGSFSQLPTEICRAKIERSVVPYVLTLSHHCPIYIIGSVSNVAFSHGNLFYWFHLDHVVLQPRLQELRCMCRANSTIARAIMLCLNIQLCNPRIIDH
ncbi:unnamed protein product, partial [Echinostoma caproni]|uniref:Fe_hyd_lg_C domain-containing protein n=1 Tax=Echinostoma caproni TaxID=27848 RepID=A0A183BEA5_9TREM